MKTTSKALNFRRGPSTGSSIIGTIPFGSTVEILQKTNSTWYKIKYGGKQGYASALYLIPKTPASVTPPATVPDVTVPYSTISSVNFRSGPAVSYSIIANLP